MRWIVELIASVLLLSGLCHAGQPVNVLVLLADDQRPDTVGALGNAEIETPNLDALVQRGTVVENTYIMGARNAAVCMPSRAMLMTGQPLFAFDEAAGVIPPEYPMLPERFRAAGYETFITGKWHQDKASLNRGFASGDRIFLGGMHDPFDAPLHPYDPEGVYPASAVVKRKGAHATTLFADAAIGFLESRSKDKPFFAYVSFTLPHDPRTVPPEYHARYADKQPSLPENFLPEHPFDNGELRVRDELLADFPRTPAEIRRHLADYYAAITHLDHEIGRILAALEASGELGNTLVVFAADNGLAIGSHGLMGKQNLYEHSARVPLVLAGPGVAQHHRVGGLAYLSDLYPTLLEWCGLNSAGSPASAKSFASALRGGAVAAREQVTLAYKNEQRALRRGPWKLIVYHVAGAWRRQLFNLETDPGEVHDRYHDADTSAIARELEELLRTEARSSGDTFPWQEAVAE